MALEVIAGAAAVVSGSAFDVDMYRTDRNLIRGVTNPPGRRLGGVFVGLRTAVGAVFLRRRVQTAKLDSSRLWKASTVPAYLLSCDVHSALTFQKRHLAAVGILRIVCI